MRIPARIRRMPKRRAKAAYLKWMQPKIGQMYCGMKIKRAVWDKRIGPGIEFTFKPVKPVEFISISAVLASGLEGGA